MPVILKIEHEDGQRTAVWEIKEEENSLVKIASMKEDDFNTFSRITNPGRRMEWLAVRVLLKEFYPYAPIINYRENGKPFLVNNSGKISISHSGKMVGIALNSSNNPGIDIEIIHPRIVKISSRFLNDTEKAYLGSQPTIEQLHIIWGAKEVLFKVYEHGGISFKDNFKIKPFTLSQKGKLDGIIDIHGKVIQVPMEYMNINNFILVQTDYL
jgi:4'-phosphopantetheinyl transferase